MMGSWPFQGTPQACRVREEPTKEAGLGQTEGACLLLPQPQALCTSCFLSVTPSM
ncbi:unnamed protein product [Gulo gulo]|uniref:Uncharacterized protein n=1 Tax=Gulo gulo TaxID=48420 RepID=A0A9X9PVU7_GULGU|nr:unnamed protein product [Gulo gulo]